MRIYTRAEWGARHRDGFGSRSLGRLNKYLHHSVTARLSANATLAQEFAAMRNLEDIGQSRFGGGISYTFGVATSGTIMQGHSINRVGAHTAGYNTTAAGIVLIGDYSSVGMSQAQIDSIAWLLAYGVSQGWWKQPLLTGGHRDTKATSCPGNAAYRQISTINLRAATLASNPGPGGIPSLPGSPGGILPDPLDPIDRSDDMKIIRRGRSGTMLRLDGGFHYIVETEADRDAFIAAGYEYRVLMTADYDRIYHSTHAGPPASWSAWFGSGDNRKTAGALLAEARNLAASADAKVDAILPAISQLGEIDAAALAADVASRVNRVDAAAVIDELHERTRPTP